MGPLRPPFPRLLMKSHNSQLADLRFKAGVPQLCSLGDGSQLPEVSIWIELNGRGRTSRAWHSSSPSSAKRISRKQTCWLHLSLTPICPIAISRVNCHATYAVV